MYEFEDIRPYNDEEGIIAFQRMAEEPLLEKVVETVFPDMKVSDFRSKLSALKSIEEFQQEIMTPLFLRILKKTSDGFTSSGLEKLDRNTPYLFISNHRDIALDSAIMNLVTGRQGFPSSEITFGSNLMMSQFIIDAGKSTKMFKVLRSTTTKEYLINSKIMSAYMRHCIIEKKSSVWIAQGDGRTKDGKDTTKPGLIKMFSYSGDKSFVNDFEELNIVPVTISYEYEPCDALKVQETYISSRETYIKKAGEDLNSILTGINQNKGKIHIHFGNTIDQSVLKPVEDCRHRYKKIAQAMDDDMHSNYHLFPNNYIAYDLLNNEGKYINKYSLEEKQSFILYMNTKLETLVGDSAELKERFLALYANPVKLRDN